MAFDGITVKSIVKECNELLLGSRIYKIAQPEKDELLLTLKTNAGQYRLFISADASLPLIYFTENNKPSPMTAPNFCMLLRKHIQNGRIISVTQPGLERMIKIDIEHLNELGDLCKKSLIIEIMGKHSNIIFCDEKNMIIDSIKHISGMVSSVREVLPGRTYFLPETEEKKDALTATENDFYTIFKKSTPLFKAIYSSFTGFSPILAQEICYRASIDSDLPANSLTDNDCRKLYSVFEDIVSLIQRQDFSPVIYFQEKTPLEFSVLPLTLYNDKKQVPYTSVSMLLEEFYATKNQVTRIRQKSADLRKIVQTILERDIKKYDLQITQMKDTLKKDKFKLYGELLHAYGYDIAPQSKSYTALNYYTNETITIPLDETLSASENAKRYFDKYNKMKRTNEALSKLTISVKEEIDHLESILSALDIALLEEDLVQIRQELAESGYIKRKYMNKKEKITSKPLHYLSSDGFDIYIGKNNYQNDELTFKFATGNDWWFHAKGMPGSHVIVKSGGTELPDTTYEDAARLAAFYSKAKGQDKIEIDYTQKKNVKKPAGGKPGFVVYYTNFSMMIDSDISHLKQIKD